MKNLKLIEIKYKMLITIFICIVLICLFYKVIMGAYKYPLMQQIIYSILIGGSFGISFYLLWTPSWSVKTSIIGDIISILLSAFFCVLPRFEADWSKENNGENSDIKKGDIEKEFKDPNEKKHCTIFILDRTMETAYTPVLSSNLIELYEYYCIKKSANCPCNPENISYIDLCRAMLCSKLLDLNSDSLKGKFVIYTLDTEVKRLYEGDIADKNAIDKAIIKLVTDTIIIDKGTESNFYSLYDTIINSMNPLMHDHDRNAFNQYTLYIYSDFIYDKKKSHDYNETKFKKNISEIYNSQKELEKKSIIQNIFVIPNKLKDYKLKNNFCEFILDTSIDKQFYKNITKLETMDIEEIPLEYYKNKYSRLSIPVYSADCNNNLSRLHSLYFPSENFWIKLKKTNMLETPNGDELQFILRFNNDDSMVLDGKFQKIMADSCVIFFNGTFPQNNDMILLDIKDEKDSHIFVQLVKSDYISKYIKYLLHFCLLSVGFFSFICVAEQLNQFFKRKVRKNDTTSSKLKTKYYV
ncbi:MAG: hypothetical protein FWF52_09205 [Candidatus Azobacteroides sp.]|nr:hypothetical protein [Candidatus Azobacteroides sp.]